jgi:hypothetical protein
LLSAARAAASGEARRAAVDKDGEQMARLLGILEADVAAGATTPVAIEQQVRGAPRAPGRSAGGGGKRSGPWPGMRTGARA